MKEAGISRRRLLHMGAGAAAVAGVARGLAGEAAMTPGSSHARVSTALAGPDGDLKKQTYRPPRIAFNWDGDDGVRLTPWPATPEKLVRTVLEQYGGTDIDTILWSPGDGMSLFNHNTRHGILFGEHADRLSPLYWTTADNGRRLREHGDEMGILSKAARRFGFNFYISLRMNDQHDRVFPEYWSPWKEKHADWLVGKYDPKNRDYSDWSGCTALNYGVPGAREYRLNLIREMVENYDINGFQLDFMSWPPFFKKDEQQKNIPVMNEFIRQVRNILDENARKRGHYMALNVQVPETPEAGLKVGLDVAAWLKEGLLDEITGGRSYAEFHVLDEWVNVARGTGVRVYANNNHEDPLEVSRAWATTHWATGVDGLHVFNYYYKHQGPFVAYDYVKGESNPLFNEIGHPEKIRFLDKTYKVDRQGKDFDFLMGAYPGGQVPAELEQGRPVAIRISCYDDLEEAVKQDRLREIRFELRMKNLAPEDRFKITVNGQFVPAESIRVIHDGNNLNGIEWVDSDKNVKKGRNEVRIELAQRTPRIKGGLVLDDINLKLTYQ